MYNRVLDIFRAVAEEGSFSAAAEKRFVTHAAVMKQINLLEERLQVKLFTRSKSGTSLTEAGQAFYAETLQIMKFSEQAIRRVQNVYAHAPLTLRVGTSVLYPCYFFMDLWDKIRDRCPQFQLKIVPFEDDASRLDRIGGEYDFVIGAFNAELDGKAYGFLPVGEYRFCLAVPRTHRLSRRKTLSLQHLSGQPMMMMRPGTSPINDSIRQEITSQYPEINLVDIDPHYTVSTFNQCVERNVMLLSLECWDRVHPDVKTIPLKEEYRLPYGVIYAKTPDTTVTEFIRALEAFVAQR